MDIRASPAKRMPHAVLAILTICVCIANTLDVNRLASLKKEIQALELKANSLKALYNTQQEALADRITDATSNPTQRAARHLSAHEKHLLKAEESNSEQKAQFQQLTKDTELVWEKIQGEIKRAKNLVRIIEVMNQEL
ncbi:unnamed protein product [Gadus morhua 'NCC']